MVDWRTLKAHPAAEIFPVMVDSDLRSLAQNIKKSGQREAVVLTDEASPRILDGRNRIAAFKLLEAEGEKIQPTLQTYKGKLKPAEYVRAANWERMHLNGKQRAELAVLMLPEAQKEAAARRVACLKKGTDSPSAPNGANGTAKKAAQVVAEKLGISARTVERAAKKAKEKDAPPAPQPTRKEQSKRESTEIAAALDTLFRGMSTFESGIRQLKLDIRDIPANLDEQKRGQYLSAALQLQRELNTLIRKLQEGH